MAGSDFYFDFLMANLKLTSHIVPLNSLYSGHINLKVVEALLFMLQQTKSCLPFP